MTKKQRMVLLASKFPVLELCGAPLDSWDPRRFSRWANGPAPSSGAIHAARFVLSVWDPATHWKVGRFDMHAALKVWDLDNRAAFLSWANRPWWP